MIISKTPYRISFFGGGSDYPEWYNQFGGEVISSTINKYLYISCRKLPNFFNHKYRVVYSKVEEVKKITDIKHKVVRLILLKKRIKNNLEIAKEINIINPILKPLNGLTNFYLNIPNSLFYEGTKILSEKLTYFEKKLEEVQKLTLEYNPILEKASKPSLINEHIKIFTSLGFFLGLFFQ
jgi:D-glycero-alpha-D-manno-heptose-7-phosphate kinase